MVRHPDVAKIAFTGGEAGGISVYKSAAESLKQVTLELGGKSANVVFDDADIESAVNGVVSGIFAATGQTCVAGSRLIIHKKIEAEVLDKIVALARTARIGNPMHLDTQVGPVTTPEQLEKILSYIDIASAEGARCELGGKRAQDAALQSRWFVEPTIFSGVKNSMRIAQEEVFGPVLSVISFEDEEEAYALANDTKYGLAAGLWTADVSRIFRGSSQLQAGTVWVNTYRAVSYMAPFGGYKFSGVGRENGREAIEAYTQTKTVWIDSIGKTNNPFLMK